MLIEEQVTTMLFHILREKMVVSGWTPDIKLFPNIDSDDPDEVEAASDLYNAACASIKNDRGFCVEVIGFSSNQYKDDKKVARIVLDVQQFLPSDLGNDTTSYYEKVVVDNVERYIRKRGVSLLSDLSFSIYALGINAKQIMIMNNLIMEAIPTRGYLKNPELPGLSVSGNFFVRLTDKGRTAELPVGIIERYYMYQMTDIQETPPTTLPGYVPPMTSVDIIEP